MDGKTDSERESPSLGRKVTFSPSEVSGTQPPPPLPVKNAGSCPAPESPSPQAWSPHRAVRSGPGSPKVLAPEGGLGHPIQQMRQGGLDGRGLESCLPWDVAGLLPPPPGPQRQAAPELIRDPNV